MEEPTPKTPMKLPPFSVMDSVVWKTPQKSTSLGIIGILTQLANVLQNVRVGELTTYLATLSYGSLIMLFGPILVYL